MSAIRIFDKFAKLLDVSWGSIADGQFLKRSGTNIVGVSSGALPVGMVANYAGATAPAGWLLCFGQLISRTTYAALFTAIGTQYSVGDGSTTFGVPDLRAWVIAGKDDMGGTASGRVNTVGAPATTLGGVGGSQTHVLIVAQMPSHTHTYALLNGGGGAAGYTTGASTYANNVSSSAGADAAHNNMQPTMFLNKIIFTGV